MSRRRHLTVTDDGSSRYVLVKGAPRGCLPQDYGIRGMWSSADRGHYVRRERVPDLYAGIDARGDTIREAT